MPFTISYFHKEGRKIVGKWSKYAKRTLCMLLSTAMVLTDAGMSVSAAESTAAAETIEENLIKDTEKETEKETKEGTDQEKSTASAESAAESKVEETTKETESQASAESVSSETESAEERTTQGTASEPEESTIEERTEEKTSVEESKTENASSAETVTETAVVEETRTEETSSVETVTETAEVEETQTEETTAEETTEETLTGETETETEVQESETQEVLAEDVIAQGTYKEDGNDITWVIDLDGKLTVTGTGDCAPVDDMIRDIPWRKHSDSIKSAVLDVKGMTSAANLFSLCDKMTSVDLSNFDTSQIVSMRTMFLDCSSLQSIDLSGFDTSNVQSMMSMFYGCSSLERLDLSSFDTSKVVNMKNMFTDCSSLSYLDMGSFDVSNTCKENDLLYEYGAGMEDMFSGCIALSEIKAPRNVPESEAPSLPHGTVWNGSDGSEYTALPIKSESITLTKAEIEGVIAQGEYKENGNDITWVIDRAGKLTVTGTGNYADLDSSSDDLIEAPWYDFRNTIISAKIHVQGMTSAEGMFWGCSQMVEVDLTDFDTRSITTMDMMFASCKSLTSLDLSKFDTSSVTTMNMMFDNCKSLTSLDLSKFDTGNVTNMQQMFSGCSELSSLDLSKFNTAKAKYMQQMFSGCKSLTSLDLSSFRTENVISMWCMFNGCSSLKTLDLSSFSFGNISNDEDEDIGSILSQCDALTQIYTPNNITISISLPEGVWQDPEGKTYTELPKGIESVLLTRDEKPQFIAQGTYQENGSDITWTIDADGKLTVIGTGDFTDDDYYYSRAPWHWHAEDIKTAEIHVKDMKNADGMFNSCSNLTSIDLADFDTSQVVSMRNMFSGCESLEHLNLSGFDTSNVECMADMFSYCSNLKNLDVSSFDTANVLNMSNMFAGCSSLEYLDLSGFDVHNASHEIEQYFKSGMMEFLTGCIGLREIKTPLNVPESESPQLPRGITWKGPDGSTYTELPKREDSITLTREDIEGVIAQGVCNDITWVIDTNGKLTVTGTGDYVSPDNQSAAVISPWGEFGEYIKTAEFNVQGITDTSDLLSGCVNLIEVDLSRLDTSNVTRMSHMFWNCKRLTTLDLSNFDTKNVHNVDLMFGWCSNLTDLDVSGFDTSSLTHAYGMFEGCASLTNLDVNGFDTSQMNCMDYMFGKCSSLTNLDVSGFDTSNVETMAGMFQGCSLLTSLDVSGFNTSKAEDMGWMFTGCSNLTSLDLSSFDLSKVAQMEDFFAECSKLTRIKTPKNVTTVSALPNGIWYDTAGNDYTELPQNLSESILLKKENIKIAVNLNNIDSKQYTYNKKPVSPTVLAETDDGIDVTNEIKDILVCTYTGTQADGTEYATTNEAPTNAGEYTLTAVIPEDSLDYIGGSQTFDFTIRKAQVTITASDISLTTGAALPKPEDYKYTISSPATEEDLEKKPTLTCSITDTSKEGTYDIVIADAALKVNPNYEAEIKYINGKVEVTAYYTVTFDLSGKGESTTQENIKKGSTISQPADPQAEGFKFTGWFKDKECTTKWDFASDKIESNTTLYAGWKAKDDDDKDDDNKDDDKDDSSEDKDDSAYTSQERVALSSVSAEIAAIKSRVYDGTAYRPGVRVTAIANGRKVTLTEGTDYRVLYKNNINAGQATVTVKGNGIYKGECSKNFTITAKPINKLKIITGGVTSGSSIQNLPVYVYDGAVLLKSGTDYTLSGYSAGTSTASVTVTGKANYTGTATAKLTVYSVSSDKIINPENVTLNVQSVPYTGKSIKNVEPTVRIGGTTLVKNKDYKVQYQNNKNAGTAFVIVTGKGAYKGKAVVPFTIKAVNAGSMNIKPLSAKTYNGKLQKPTVTVTVNGKKLSKDKDYTVTYKNNLHAGTATVIVTGKGNYAGMKGEAKFTINPQKISKASVKGTQGNLTLTYSKRTLKEGADYEKPIYGSASKNKIKVTIKGKKDFTGEVTKSVKIH